jgi:hypothetical protein
MLFSDYEDIFSQFNNFNHAIIADVQMGPRQAVTVTLNPLLWKGSLGHVDDSEIKIRFGGIQHFDSIRPFFAELQAWELGWIRFSPEKPSKKGQLFIDFALERTGKIINFECQNVSVENPPDPVLIWPWNKPKHK